MSTLSALRQTPTSNSRLTGGRQTPNRRRHRQARTGEADFPRREREQDAIPPVRQTLPSDRLVNHSSLITDHESLIVESAEYPNPRTVESLAVRCHRRADGVASPRPLSAVIRDSSKSASQVSRSPAAMSTLSPQRLTPTSNSRLTGGRQTPNRRRHRQARTGEADFPRREREQDAIPPVRRFFDDYFSLEGGTMFLRRM
jgi:hypothetical protein